MLIMRKFDFVKKINLTFETQFGKHRISFFGCFLFLLFLLKSTYLFQKSGAVVLYEVLT